MDGRGRQEIERILMQFDRNQAAAGPLNSVVNRMLDILPTVIRVAEVLHTADLSERESQLMLRLQLGLPAALVPIASALGTNLNRPQTWRSTKLADDAGGAPGRGFRLLTIVDGDKELRQLILDAAEQLDELEQAA